MSDADGNLLAVIDEPHLTNRQRICRAAYGFTHPKQGLRRLNHHLEIQGPAGELVFSLAKRHEFALLRTPMSVFGSDGVRLGTAVGAWSGTFRRKFSLFDAQDVPLGELRRLGPGAMRFAVIDRRGVAVANFGSARRIIGDCDVLFSESVSKSFRVLVIGCAIVLHQAF
jgi:hypothetical protein